MTAVCMIYGATGFTGRLILDMALTQGLRPVIAGRNEMAVRGLADRHQLPFRSFSLDNPVQIADALADVDVVLNAAGPFSSTAERLAHVCIAEGVHYLDICCERPVLERMAMLHETARAAGVTLLPGAGFSPAVGEALAVHLKRRLPRTVRLVIALSAPVPPSAGVIRTGLEAALRPSAVLRRGRVRTRLRRHVRRFDFGRGKVRCYGLAWGELAAIPRATGVRNIDFFVHHRPDLDRLLHLSPLTGIFRALPPVRKRLEAWTEAHGAGPSPERRKRVRSRLAGYAYDSTGQRAVTRLHLPDPYTVTAELAVMALTRMMSKDHAPGVLTPTQCLGPDFLAEIPGLPVDWEELELSAPGELKLRIRRHVPWLHRWAPGAVKISKIFPLRLRGTGTMSGVLRQMKDGIGLQVPPAPEKTEGDLKAGNGTTRKSGGQEPVAQTYTRSGNGGAESEPIKAAENEKQAATG